MGEGYKSKLKFNSVDCILGANCFTKIKFRQALTYWKLNQSKMPALQIMKIFKIKGTYFLSVYLLKLFALAKAKVQKNKNAQAGRWKGKSTNAVKLSPIKAAHKTESLICFLYSRSLKV